MSRRGIRGPVVGAAAVLLVAACAQGTGGSDDAPSFGGEPEATLSVMGFGTGDEIGQVRFDRASAALEGTTIELSEGELDIQAFLSSVASGNPPDLINAAGTRSARSPRAGRSSRSRSVWRPRASTRPLSSRELWSR